MRISNWRVHDQRSVRTQYFLTCSDKKFRGSVNQIQFLTPVFWRYLWSRGVLVFMCSKCDFSVFVADSMIYVPLKGVTISCPVFTWKSFVSRLACIMITCEQSPLKMYFGVYWKLLRYFSERDNLEQLTPHAKINILCSQSSATGLFKNTVVFSVCRAVLM